LSLKIDEGDRKSEDTMFESCFDTNVI
jgi:hypothetical protein